MGAAEDFFASLTPERVERLIAEQEPESVHHDYISYRGYRTQKKGFDYNVDNIAKPISAFANTDGGVILYGLQSKPLNDPKRDVPDDWETPPANFVEAVVAVARDRVSPAIGNLTPRRIECPSDPNKAVTAILVPRSRIAPHQVSDSFLYYHRIGDTTKEMSHDLLELTFRARHAAEFNVFPVLSPHERPVDVGPKELHFAVTNTGNSPAVNLEIQILVMGVVLQPSVERGVLGVGEDFAAHWGGPGRLEVPNKTHAAHMAGHGLSVRITYSDLGGNLFELSMPFVKAGPSSASFVRPLTLRRNGLALVGPSPNPTIEVSKKQ